VVDDAAGLRWSVAALLGVKVLRARPDDGVER
jgi:hypothetical protein